MNADFGKEDVWERREWCYVQMPAVYSIAGCACGNDNPQWSEFKSRLWCEPCAIDFVPEHNGIFDGPIGIGAANLLGISFDRFDILSGERLKFPDYASENKVDVSVRL